MSKIAVIGTGYVGLTTGACFAHIGHDVVCADIDAGKVERLQRGEIPILEDGLDNLVHEGIQNGRLCFVVGAVNARSEEHTSELQSLMSTSSAGICLKKKTTQRHRNTGP